MVLWLSDMGAANELFRYLLVLVFPNWWNRAFKQILGHGGAWGLSCSQIPFMFFSGDAWEVPCGHWFCRDFGTWLLGHQDGWSVRLKHSGLPGEAVEHRILEVFRNWMWSWAISSLQLWSSRALGQMTSRSPFHPQPFCEQISEATI